MKTQCFIFNKNIEFEVSTFFERFGNDQKQWRVTFSNAIDESHKAECSRMADWQNEVNDTSRCETSKMWGLRVCSFYELAGITRNC